MRNINEYFEYGHKRERQIQFTKKPLPFICIGLKIH